MNEYINKAKEIFENKFKQTPLLIYSPGRVNLIGEHTDYNMGFVLPAAINKAIIFAIAPRKDKACNLYSIDMQEEEQFSIDKIAKSKKSWANYLIGVVDQFIKAGHSLNGFDCVFGGDIPVGAGMSSSAAIEGGLAFALNHIFNLNIEKINLVKMAQKAENEFVGVKCGIMDQYINIFGKENNVLQIDCRSLEYKYFPFNFANISIVLFDTGVSHSLASSEYNKRREECTIGVNTIKQSYPQINSLRDVSIQMLNEFKNKLEPIVYLRCKYVVEEIDRLQKACIELANGNLKSFGQYMYQTHTGLSQEYNVSCKELDFLVSAVKDNKCVYGARMMGGGFGGCTINLIENNAVDQISNQLSKEYKIKFNIDLKTYVTSLGAGTHIIS